MEILKAVFTVYRNILKEIFGLSVNRAKTKIKKMQEKREVKKPEHNEDAPELNYEQKEELKKRKFPPKKSKTYVILTEIGILFSTSIYICAFLALFATLMGDVRSIAAFGFILPYAAFFVALLFIFEFIVLIPTYAIEYKKYKKGFFKPEDFEKTADDKFTEFYTSFSIVVLFILAYVWIKYFRPEF